MPKMTIKKNDRVRVTTGRNRGQEGRVLRVIPGAGKAVVEGVNQIKRHTRPNPQRQIQGGILEREAPIQLSNLRLLCPDCGAATRVGHRRLEDGTGVRYCKKCNATIG